MGVVWDLHMIDTKDAVVRFPKGTTLLRDRLNLVLRCPEDLVFSYTSLDRSERSVNSNDGVVRTISFTESDSCIG